jgi:thiol-disulfide isomerase/thioredoxin
MRRTALCLLILVFTLSTALAEKPQRAADILKAAQSKATEQNKSVFLVFGASWCEACHQLDTFLALPDVAPIIDKYFVVAHLTFGERVAGHPDWDTPGSDLLIAKYGGISPTGMVGLPFIAIVDAKAKLLANSAATTKSKPGSNDAGFPTDPDEIKSFLFMIQKGSPAITTEELHKLEDGLHQAAAD